MRERGFYGKLTEESVFTSPMAGKGVHCLKILVTGFDPFGGERVNPAWEAVRRLPETLDGAALVKLELPTVFGLSARLLEAAIETHRPDMVLCVGQAGGSAALAIERVAVNLQDAAVPDNAGNRPVDEPVRADGPAAYFSTLPVKAMAAALAEAGIPAVLSCSAGTYVCNSLMYALLDALARRYPDIRGGFLHVPYTLEQAAARPAGTPGMALEEISRGLEAAIRAALGCAGVGGHGVQT